MNLTECDRGSILIAFSVKFHGYKRLQNVIRIVFRNQDFPKLVFLILSRYVFLMGIRKLQVAFRIRRRFYWCTRHWILIRLARSQESRHIVWEIQIVYFLILVMMNKMQIHSCFNNTIIDMYIKIMLPLGHCLNASDCAGIVSGPYVMSNHEFFWKFFFVFTFPAISVSRECFAPFHASHGCCKLYTNVEIQTILVTILT